MPTQLFPSWTRTHTHTHTRCPPTYLPHRYLFSIRYTRTTPPLPAPPASHLYYRLFWVVATHHTYHHTLATGVSATPYRELTHMPAQRHIVTCVVGGVTVAWAVKRYAGGVDGLVFRQ